MTMKQVRTNLNSILFILLCMSVSVIHGQADNNSDVIPQFSKTALSTSVDETTEKFSATFYQDSTTIPVATGGSTNAGNIFLSLLVPGLGEYAAGNKKAAKFFFGTEILLWSGFYGSQTYLNVLQDDLESYAARHAGVVDADSKGDQYWIDIGLSPDIYAFNANKLLERDLDGRYEENRNNEWVWDSEDNQISYAQKRIDRVDWKKNANLIIGGLVLNRIISAIDVIRIVRKNRNLENQARQSYLNLRYSELAHEGKALRMNLTVLF